MKKLLLIDGNAILHRAYHSLPPFKTAKGEVTNAIYGFLKMFLDVLKKEKPDYVGIAWDRAAPTFRHQEYTEYKATRAAPPEDLYPQLPRLKEVLQTLHIAMLEKDGYEADDILGTLSHHTETQHHEVITLILTGDRDALQLVTQRTNVIAPIRGVSDVFVYTPHSVKEKIGVRPDQIIDYKALCGDTSDNIPGVPGIGPKQASEFLQKYETLDNLYKHLEELTPAQTRKLTEGKDSAYLSQKIATILLNTPVDTDLEHLNIGPADYPKFRELITELEFKTLIPKIEEFKKVIPAAPDNSESGNQQSLF
ncbi:MAG TPA: 5'-3' exonuclease H3TH domain-containing protein [Candidatus Gracilibacteria bacterium]|nr:5'-3' exonuclease H3TH domain-containing protein [Candidatus Gracilibacteria bacterium]